MTARLKNVDMSPLLILILVTGLSLAQTTQSNSNSSQATSPAATLGKGTTVDPTSSPTPLAQLQNASSSSILAASVTTPTSASDNGTSSTAILTQGSPSPASSPNLTSLPTSIMSSTQSSGSSSGPRTSTASISSSLPSTPPSTFSTTLSPLTTGTSSTLQPATQVSTTSATMPSRASSPNTPAPTTTDKAESTAQSSTKVERTTKRHVHKCPQCIDKLEPCSCENDVHINPLYVLPSTQSPAQMEESRLKKIKACRDAAAIYGFCQGYHRAWSYVGGNICIPFTYSGCGPSMNVFRSKWKCLKQCGLRESIIDKKGEIYMD